MGQPGACNQIKQTVMWHKRGNVSTSSANPSNEQPLSNNVNNASVGVVVEPHSVQQHNVVLYWWEITVGRCTHVFA